MRRGFFLGTAAMLLTLLALGGCSDERAAEAEAPAVLKVADVDQRNFYNMYGDYIGAVYPDTDIQLITTSAATDYKISREERLQRWKELLANETPDLIVIRDDETYRMLADEGLLVDLAPFMQASQLSDKQLHPGVIEYMKQNRDGLMYGMGTTFSATRLYYNEDLFREYGIDPPHDGMTWTELLDLAYRFTAASAAPDAPIGYYQAWSGPSELASTIGMTEGISMYRLSAGTMTVDTPAWRKVFDTVLSSYKSGTFRALTPAGEQSEDGETYYDAAALKGVDLFAKGKAAMTIAYYDSYKTDSAKFTVKSVNPPVDEATRTRSYSFYANQKLAIRSGSPQTKASWNFIRFMVSDYVAKVSASQTMDIGMPSNLAFQQYARDEAAAALYRQMPAMPPLDEGAAVDGGFYKEMEDMLKQEIADALSDKQSVDEMLQRMQEQGQRLIDEARNKADGMNNPRD